MKELKFYLQKNPRGESYHARTLVAGKYSKKGFIKKMLKDNPNLNEYEIERVLNQAWESFVSVMREGCSLVFPGQFRASPVVKGNFKSEADRFYPTRHWVVPTFTFSSRFLNYFKELMKATKADYEPKTPTVTKVYNNRGAQGLLCRRFINNIYGIFFKRKGYEFRALEISRYYDKGESIRVEASELDLVSHSNKEICCGLGPYFEPPQWLTDGISIHLTLIYYKVSSGKEIKSFPFDLLWSDC